MGDASDWLQGDTFDATMNYTFRQLALDFFATETSNGFGLADGLARMNSAYAPAAIDASQNLLGSHDTARFLREADDRPERLHRATVLQMTLPGSPGLYYGDEGGMTGGEEPPSRGAFPWHQPEQWDHTQLDLVRTLADLRRTHPALPSGSLEIVSRTEDTIVYVRSDASELVLVGISRSNDLVDMDIPAPSKNPRVLWGSGQVLPVSAGIAISGLRGAVLVRL